MKLLALLVATTALVLVRSPLAVVVGVAVVAVAFAVARMPVGVAWAQVRPLRWFVVLLVPVVRTVTDEVPRPRMSVTTRNPVAPS